MNKKKKNACMAVIGQTLIVGQKITLCARCDVCCAFTKTDRLIPNEMYISQFGKQLTIFYCGSISQFSILQIELRRLGNDVCCDFK